MESGITSISCLIRLCIINAMMLGGIGVMCWLATIALGSITTAAGVAATAVSASTPTAGNRSPLQGSGNYQGADAVSALTGLSNGYMASYYHQLGNTLEQQHQNQHPYHLHGPTSHNPESVDKEATGRGMQLHTSHYGNGVVGGTSGAISKESPAAAAALEIFNIPESGFIPTTLSAAGQHYAASFLGLQSVADKNNVQVTEAGGGAGGGGVASGKLDLQQSPATKATAYASMSMTAANNNGPAPSLYGRLSNYDEEQKLSIRSGDGDGNAMVSFGHNIVTAYDNYAAGNLYADQSGGSNTNQGEQMQNFANYFTPTTTSMATSSTASTYGGGPQSPHKYLPLNNYHNTEMQPQQHYQTSDKQNIYNRAISLDAAAVASDLTSPSQKAGYLETYANYNNYPKNNNNNNNENGNKPSSAYYPYETWNNYIEKHGNDNYQTYQNQQQQQQEQSSQLQRHFHQNKEEQNTHQKDYREPEAATYILHSATKEKRSKHKQKSKRSDPHGHEIYEDASPYPHDDTDEAHTIQIQQQQLEELHHQLQQQQQQFINLQHQLIDHDQQLQIQKQQHHTAPPIQPHLPPITQVVHHNSHSLQALSGTPLAKHTHVVRTIPIAQHQQVYVPTRQNISVEVPDPIITTVNRPVPIEVPVSKTIAIPQIKEVKIPIERVRPFPVERPIPYLIEKRVPYTVEKQIAQPVYYHVPIKVPIVHTVVHKLHNPHAYSYQHQRQHSHPLVYTGHIRHPIHHHGGHGHSHYSNIHYKK
uniref:Uncharacterized protein n=1 Tax=Musca domestica TaxID=7370 RepID=A0A1I8NGG1_MUSDO